MGMGESVREWECVRNWGEMDGGGSRWQVHEEWQEKFSTHKNVQVKVGGGQLWGVQVSECEQKRLARTHHMHAIVQSLADMTHFSFVTAYQELFSNRKLRVPHCCATLVGLDMNPYLPCVNWLIHKLRVLFASDLCFSAGPCSWIGNSWQHNSRITLVVNTPVTKAWKFVNMNIFLNYILRCQHRQSLLAIIAFGVAKAAAAATKIAVAVAAAAVGVGDDRFRSWLKSP